MGGLVDYHWQDGPVGYTGHLYRHWPVIETAPLHAKRFSLPPVLVLGELVLHGIFRYVDEAALGYWLFILNDVVLHTDPVDEPSAGQIRVGVFHTPPGRIDNGIGIYENGGSLEECPEGATSLRHDADNPLH